jgi:hypothetical protein
MICPLLRFELACSDEKPLCGWCDFSRGNPQQSAHSNVSPGEGIKASHDQETHEGKPPDTINHTPQEQKATLPVCRCGDSFEPASNRQKLCAKCGKENETRGTRERVANHRKRKRGDG